MKNLLIASAAAAAFLVPAAASAQVGYVGASYADANDVDASDWNIDGAVVVPVGPLNLQLDASVGRLDTDAFGDEDHGSIGAHLFLRNEQFAAGAAVKAYDEGLYSYGVEGAFYLPQVTLSASWNQLTDESEGGLGDFADTWNIGGRFFATDNLALGLTYGNVDLDGVGDADAWGANIEYKFDATPVSIFAGYDNSNDADVDIWSLGARFHFGAATLKEQDRNGASMGHANGITNFLF